MTETIEQFKLPTGDLLPEQLPVLPLRDSVVFPFSLVPLGVAQERSVRLVDAVMRGGQPRLMVLAAQKSPDIDNAGPEDIYTIATVGAIQQLARRPDGVLLMVVQGLERVRITEWLESEPYIQARIEYAPPLEIPNSPELVARQRHMLELFTETVQLTQSLPDELIALANNINDPVKLAYMVAGNLKIEREQAQNILEIDDPIELADRIVEVLQRELEVLQIGKRIRGQAEEQMNKAQREYFLRQQLTAIQKELGESDENSAEITQLRERIEAVNLPEEARREATRELNRLERLPAASPEHGMIRTYLDLLLSLPWQRSSGGEINVSFARQVLDEDHYDLEKIKERILEYLAVRKLRHDRHVQANHDNIAESSAEEQYMREPILCFIGPPGVGKTSLGQSIARAMGRKFARISLGGVHDEAEIRGHRRTYIGAMPGRIIQTLRRVDVNDPVFMLDEVDKLSPSIQGDPTAAMLEVLDPEQNKEFRDTYLDVPFDLSHVLFIATANNLDTIPPPLRDRMEILELSGYTEDEKVHIADQYLLPKEIRAHGLRPDEVLIDESAVRRIISDYTREAGVRNLDRMIATVIRKGTRMLSEGQQSPIVVSAENLPDFLGRQRFFPDVAERTDKPGVATGLVWTPVGGEIIFIEAAMMPAAEERLILTGMLGDVMRESAQAALTYVRSNAEKLGIDPRVFEGKQVHIHVPAGAIPKDGPSAGITMATAIASLASGRPVRSDVAMTGEITLRGKVLPIGGLKEKALAAHRAGITTVIIPRRNEADLDEMPAELREAVHFVPVDEAGRAIDIALEAEVAAAA